MTRVTIKALQKLRDDGVKIAVLTCYDASFAAMLDAAGLDSLLIGDSLGMVLQGHETTLPVTLADSYNRFFYHFNGSPVLIVNSEKLNFVSQDRDLDLLIERVGAMRGKREFFNWGD